MFSFCSLDAMPSQDGQISDVQEEAMAEPKPDTPDLLELAVEEAIDVCDGDVRAALRAALVANSFLTAEVERLTQAVSFGFTRGRSAARRASEKLDNWREISSTERIRRS
jgi:hypothetical protein